MKKNQIIAVTVLGVVLAVAGWWFVLYSPRKTALAEAKKILISEQQKKSTLDAELARRQSLVKIEPKLDLRLAQLSTWLPDQPNLPQFINDATTIAKDSGIDFVSISPGTPAAGAAGQGVISLSIQIKGGFFQLLDYLVRVEKLPRTVVIDSLQISPALKDDGSVQLAVGVTGRMFTSSVPQFTSVPPSLQAPVAGTSVSNTVPAAPKAPGATQTAAPAPVPAGAAASGRP